MSANSNQKLKLLYVYKMLKEESDQDHGLSMTQILEHLEKVGISAERKGIYRDIDVLREFGLTINVLQRMPVEYTLVHEGMSLSELSLAIDSVQANKHLSQETCASIVDALRSEASVFEKDLLDKDIYTSRRIKEQSNSILANIHIIQKAIRLNKKISFIYFKYDNRMNRLDMRPGEPFVVTPVKLIYSENVYYVIAWFDSHDCFVRFRVDHLASLEVSAEDATQNDAIAAYDAANSEYPSFGSPDAELVNVRLVVKPGSMDLIADCFGTDVAPVVGKDGSAEVCVKLHKGAQFFGWIASTNGMVKIAESDALAKEYKAWVKSLAESL